jgi:hypothetical protein
MRDTCEDLFKKRLVTDYNKKIKTIDEAKQIFKEIKYEEYKEHLNNSIVQQRIEGTINSTRLYDGKYRVNFGFDCYELSLDGKLYRFYCGG